MAEGEDLFQGFRVKAEDAKRLKDLHRTLQKNKVSQDEMKEVLKRERRRAEKALSNSKRNVCYNCREVKYEEFVRVFCSRNVMASYQYYLAFNCVVILTRSIFVNNFFPLLVRTRLGRLSWNRGQ